MSTSILDRTPPRADHRLPYGPDPLQFGDLWLPRAHAGKHPGGRWPVLLFIHGGWWKSAYSLDYAGFLCDAIREHGVAVWSLEYRRVGDAGGGWPGTFQDVAAGADHLPQLARDFPVDPGTVVAAGHSAGGHLAFWLAGRHHIPPSSPLFRAAPATGLRGVVALAGAVDLRLTVALGGFFRFSSGKPATLALMGGSPEQVPDRYHAGNPGDLLPLNIPQALIQGSEDDQIPPQLPQEWAAMARRQGDQVAVKIVPLADHFDLVDPESVRGWPESRDAILNMFR